MKQNASVTWASLNISGRTTTQIIVQTESLNVQTVTQKKWPGISRYDTWAIC